MMAASPYSNTMGIENDGISNEVEVWFLSSAVVEAPDGSHMVRVEAVGEPSLAGWWMNIEDMKPVAAADMARATIETPWLDEPNVSYMGEVEPGDTSEDRHQDLEAWLVAEERHEERVETMNQWLAAEAEYEAAQEAQQAEQGSDDATE